MTELVKNMLHEVHTYLTLAEQYEELLDLFDPDSSDTVEYENYYNRIDRIWQELEESRELGEGNDEILDAWERCHIKACEVYQQIKPI